MQASAVRIAIDCTSESGHWYAKVKDFDQGRKEILFFQRDAKPGFLQTVVDFFTGVKAGEVVARDHLIELGIAAESEVNIAGAPRPDPTRPITNADLNEVFQYASKRQRAGLSLDYTGAPVSRHIREKNESVEIIINSVRAVHEPFESQQAYKTRLVSEIRELLQAVNCPCGEDELERAVEVGVDVATLRNSKRSLPDMQRASSFLTELRNAAKSVEFSKKIDFMIDDLDEKILSARRAFTDSVLNGFTYDSSGGRVTLPKNLQQEWSTKLDLLFDISEEIADPQKTETQAKRKATLTELKNAAWTFAHATTELNSPNYVGLDEAVEIELDRRLEICKKLLKAKMQ